MQMLYSRAKRVVKQKIAIEQNCFVYWMKRLTYSRAAKVELEQSRVIFREVYLRASGEGRRPNKTGIIP